MPGDSLTSLSHHTVSIAPSILAADFARLGEEIAAIDAAGAEVIHVDVMDGHFVPNLTIGPPVVKALRGCSKRPFDVHLMVTDPQDFVAPFAEAGADGITIHVEIEGDVHGTLEHIRSRGCSRGISLRPNTPASDLEPYIDEVELILVMTVEPGFGGQSFRADMLPKIREIREMIRRSGRSVHLEVDGGINPETAPRVIEAGANLLVAGTSVFRAPNGPAAAIRVMKGQ